MLVDVKRDDGTVFQTVAFAIVYGKDFLTEFFILNEEDEFERVYEFKRGVSQITEQVFIRDLHRFSNGWLDEKDREGYKEFIHHPKVLDKIRKGEKDIFDFETMALWRSLTGAVGHEVDYGPHSVEDEESLANLMAFARDFHDARIDKAEYSEDKKNVTLYLREVWGVELLKLHFEDVIEMGLTEEYQWDYFYEASIFFPKGNGVVFTNYERTSSLEKARQANYVWARKMSYTFEYTKEKEDAPGRGLK